MKESRSTPPASPAHSLSSVSSLFPGPGAAKLGNNLTDSPVSLASGLAPGSYPHPGQAQTNGGPAPGLGLQNNLPEHLQQQKVKGQSNHVINGTHKYVACSRYQNLCHR